MSIKYNWVNVPEHINWQAVDADGRRFGYVSRPVLSPEAISSWNLSSMDEGAPESTPIYLGLSSSADWKNSLEGRPEGNYLLSTIQACLEEILDTHFVLYSHIAKEMTEKVLQVLNVHVSSPAEHTATTLYDWSSPDVPDRVEYIATDGDGHAFGFDKEPVLDLEDKCFFATYEEYKVVYICKRPAENWENSLENRPRTS